MSVLIKGLEMPEKEYMDVRIFQDGTARIATGKKPYYREFEAVDVPTPHGSLIDGDELIKKLEHQKEIYEVNRDWESVKVILYDINEVRHMKTVIAMKGAALYR